MRGISIDLLEFQGMGRGKQSFGCRKEGTSSRRAGERRKRATGGMGGGIQAVSLPTMVAN